MLGYGRMILKSDQEPAIKDLQKAVQQRRWDELKGIAAAVKGKWGGETTLDLGNGGTVLENSTAGDSRANGFIERSIQEIEGQIRTIKAYVDHTIGKEIPRGHDLLPWLVSHCADSINRYSKGPDGRTAYHRIKGQESSKKVCRFGEKVQWKPLPVKANRRTPIEARWQYGFWLGFIFRTDETIIGTDRGVLRCRDFRRLPEGDGCGL